MRSVQKSRRVNRQSPAVCEVVLVDDDADFALMLGTLLSQEGYSVVTELTYSGAAQYLATHTPDILITDIRLGQEKENGWQLAKQARAQQPNLQVIVVTGLANHLDADAEYWRLPVFLKPFDPDHLFTYLRSSTRPPVSRSSTGPPVSRQT
jgi:DNA-binding NtrC family response regulator